MKQYFSVEYEISLADCDAILEKLHKLNNTKLYNLIKKTLINVRQDSDIMSCFQK